MLLQDCWPSRTHTSHRRNGTDFTNFRTDGAIVLYRVQNLIQIIGEASAKKSEAEANVDVRRPTSDPKRMRILDQRPNECGFLDVRRPTSGFGSTVHKGVSLSNDMNTRNRGTSILLYGQVGERDSAELSTSKLHFWSLSHRCLSVLFLDDAGFSLWLRKSFVLGSKT